MEHTQTMACPRCLSTDTIARGHDRGTGKARRSCKTCTHAWTIGGRLYDVEHTINPPCIHCGAHRTYKHGPRHGKQTYVCTVCRRPWSDHSAVQAS